MKSCTI